MRQVYVTARSVEIDFPEKPFIRRVTTPFDDPDHPYGQWTVRLTWDGLAQSGPDSFFVVPRYQLEFLVDEPLSKIEKEMTLELFDGLWHMASLTVAEVIETP